MGIEETFVKLVLSAHEGDENDRAVSSAAEIALIERAGAWAAANGWEVGFAGMIEPNTKAVISGADGELVIALDTGRTLTYPTGSPMQTLEQLVVVGMVPIFFSYAAWHMLQDLARAHEAMASHLVNQHPGNPEMASCAAVWLSAADSARDYLPRRQQDLLASTVALVA